MKSPALLNPLDVVDALPRIAPGLAKYQRIQARLHETDVREDRDFQRAFNGFYRVRRGADWQQVFYALLEQEKAHRRGFESVLRDLHAATGRHEASFASKLAASVNPALPVLDAFVLKNVGLRLPSAGRRDRLDAIVDVHAQVGRWYANALSSPYGKAAVQAFDAVYPDSGVTDLKKLDLVLWQMR